MIKIIFSVYCNYFVKILMYEKNNLCLDKSSLEILSTFRTFTSFKFRKWPELHIFGGLLNECTLCGFFLSVENSPRGKSALKNATMMDAH